MKVTKTRWMVEKMFQNRGWILVKKNGKNILCKRF